jgi:hypothetical protein
MVAFGITGLGTFLADIIALFQRKLSIRKIIFTNEFFWLVIHHY